MVAFSLLVLAATGWQVVWSFASVSFNWFGDQPTIAEVRATSLHLFFAALFLATLPAVVGVLRGRFRWLVVAAVPVAWGVYVLVSPIDPDSVLRPCTPQTCVDFHEPNPVDDRFRPLP